MISKFLKFKIKISALYCQILDRLVLNNTLFVDFIEM